MAFFLPQSSVTDWTSFFYRVGDFAPLFGVPVLLGVIERPFFSAAGLTRNVVWYSIQANCVSFLLGGVVGACILPMSGGNGAFGVIVSLLMWLLMLMPFVTLVETWTVRAVAGRTPYVDFIWILAGNIVSSLVCYFACVGIPQMLDTPRNRVTMQPYQAMSGVILAWSSLAAIVAAFVVPRFRSKHIPADAEPHESGTHDV